jgi:hypothetical protein
MYKWPFGDEDDFFPGLFRVELKQATFDGPMSHTFHIFADTHCGFSGGEAIGYCGTRPVDTYMKDDPDKLRDVYMGHICKKCLAILVVRCQSGEAATAEFNLMLRIMDVGFERHIRDFTDGACSQAAIDKVESQRLRKRENNIIKQKAVLYEELGELKKDLGEAEEYNERLIGENDDYKRQITKIHDVLNHDQ